MEVGEKNVANRTPASTTRLVVGLIAGLWYQSPRPSFDIGRVVHIIIVADGINVSHYNIFH